MKSVALLVLLLPSVALADRSIVGEKSATIDCSKDPEVAINSGEGTYTFTGTCTKIAVNGSQNKLTIENVVKLAVTGSDNVAAIGGADKIAVTGSGNKITYKKPVSAKKTKVATLGTGNKVTQTK